jgi:hypothetical protein
MIAMIRYQLAVLLRSHRWVGPFLLYVALLVLFADSQPLGEGLDWSAAMLVPAAALLTRSMLTAEPAEARACIAAAGGTHKAQIACCIAALAAGGVLGLAGACYELARDPWPGRASLAHLGHAPAAFGLGLAITLICLLVGCAIGVFFNPPVVRHPAMAILCTIGAVVLGLVSSISPASAALRHAGSAPPAHGFWPGSPLLAALGLLVVSWAVSALLAGRRGG